MISGKRRMARVRTYGQGDITYMWMWIAPRNSRWRNKNRAHAMRYPRMIKMLRRQHRDMLVHTRKLKREAEKRGNRWDDDI